MKLKIFSTPVKILCGLFVLSIFPLANCNALFSASIEHSFGISDDGQPGGFYTLSWTAVQPSTTGAIVTYYVFEEFGKDAVDAAGTLPADIANRDYSTRETSIEFQSGTGSRCFVVVSSDSLNGVGDSTRRLCHDFIHGETEGSTIGRTDGDGTDRGVDQQWDFKFYMDADAYVTAKILPPGTTFTFDANQLVIEASSAPVRTLIEATGPPSPALTGEGSDGTKFVTLEWDSRYSTGTVVPNGIYYLWVQAYLDRGQLFPPPDQSSIDATPETYLRDGKVITIPVNIIRIMNLSATPISLTQPQSTISYFLNADANVRVLIAKPGSFFFVDANGDIQAANATTLATDPTLIVSTFTFQRKAGENTETWDGTSSTGTVMPSGVYVVGISARDDYGNHAISVSGDDYPIFTNISLERSAGSVPDTGTGDTTPPTIAAMTVDGAAFADGQVFSGAVSTITVRLSDTSGIGFGLSNITVVDPNSQAVAGTLTNNGSDTLTFVFTTPQDENGTYTITITGADGVSNSTTYTRTFGVIISLSQGAFESSLDIYPNPARNTASATVRYNLSVPSVVTVDLFNLLGEKINSTSFNETVASNGITRTIALTNESGERIGSGLYLVRIKAAGSSSTVETVKKLVVIR